MSEVAPEAMLHGDPPNVASASSAPDERIREQLGHAIKVGREEAGMTQAHAAEVLGVSRATLIRWEAGQGSPPLERIREVFPLRLMPRNQYPSAPLDPELRREFLWRRNAAISQVEDPDAYVDLMRAQHARHTQAEKR